MQMAPGRFESPWPGPSNVGYAESSTSLESPTFDESHSSTLAAGYPSLMTDPRERWSKHSHTSSTRSFSPIDSWSGRSTSRQAHPQSRTTSRSSSGFDSHSRTGDWSGGGSDWETQCKRLKEENLVLNGEVTTWKNAYQVLVNAVPSLLQEATPFGNAKLAMATSSEKTIHPFDQADYPDVNFWNLQDWKLHQSAHRGISKGPRGNVMAAQGINVSMLYVEDRNGESIDGFAAAFIRSTAHRVFQQLMDLDMAPKTWGAVGAQAAKHFRHEMASEIPELRLCSNHWKADYLATHIYPSWRSHARPAIIIKSEYPDLLDDSTSNLPGKRPHTALKSPTRRKKARRSEEEKASMRQATMTTPSADELVDPPPPASTILVPVIQSTLFGPNTNLPVIWPSVPDAPLFTETAVPAAPNIVAIPLSLPVLSPVVAAAPEPQLVTNTQPAIAQPVYSVALLAIDPVLVGSSEDQTTLAIIAPTYPNAVSDSNHVMVDPIMPSIEVSLHPGRKMVPTKSTTARNLCAIAWCDQNLDGTVTQFAAHWDQIKATSEAQPFIKSSSDTKLALKKEKAAAVKKK